VPKLAKEGIESVLGGGVGFAFAWHSKQTHTMVLDLNHLPVGFTNEY